MENRVCRSCVMNKKEASGRKRFFARTLALTLLLCLLAGCAVLSAAPDGESTPLRTDAPATEASGTEKTTDPQITAGPALPSIPWSAAFRTKSVPEGSVAADSIAFLRKNSDGTMTVENVSIAEVLAAKYGRLPRSHYYEQYMPRVLIDELLPALDYAIAHGFSRLCIPTAGFNYGTVEQNDRFLTRTYWINECKIGALSVRELEQEDGTILRFMLINIGGMESRDTMDLYLEGMAAAEAIVDAMPEGLDEAEKMLYLYRWIADRVRYNNIEDPDAYYTGKWCMLYDALVKHSTVCAGYSEALYVLCNLAGIDCIPVEGFVNEALGADSHAWNAARIDGKYYQFDATWDEGLPPADYAYYGMSSEYCMENHTKYLISFSEEYTPPCPEDLFPAILPVPAIDDPAYKIFWYYKLCNARDALPMSLFGFFGYKEDEVNAQAPQDGWVTTSVPLKEYCENMLGYIMTEEQIGIFLDGKLKSDANGMTMYRVPEQGPVLPRLAGVEKNEDGSWTASLLDMTPDGSFTPREERITMQESEGSWFVDGAA